MLLPALLALAPAAVAEVCPAPEDRVLDAPTLVAEEVARALAPVLFVEGARRSERRHWDLPMAVDFDGDQVSRNNASALRSGAWLDRIVPTLYWSVLETETHVFATYHAFHGLDWTWYPPVLNYEWHENDGENLQIVARRAGPGVEGLEVVLVATQAHLATHFAHVGDADFGDGLVDVSEEPAWTTPDGRVAVYMAKGSHALVPAADKARRFVSDGPYPQLRRGIRLAPAAAGAPAAAPSADDVVASYELRSTEDTFWTPGADIVGHGRLMDQTFRYCDAVVGSVVLPRHYDASMLAGLGKRDSGIAPFALDIGLASRKARLGALFFDPARRYAELFDLTDAWSQIYLSHPYALRPGVANASDAE